MAVGPHDIFPHYLIECTTFGRKLLNTCRVETLHCLQYSVPFPPSILKKFQISTRVKNLVAAPPVSVPQNHNLFASSSRQTPTVLFLYAFEIIGILYREQEGSNKIEYILVFPTHTSDTFVWVLIE
jgi:hypothetical protein